MKHGSCGSRGAPMFIKEEATTCSLQSELEADYVLDNYRGVSKFSLSRANDFLLKDGKVYNLLERMSPKRRIRCGCVKSNCQAKYCECYRAGETCGESCGCVGCKNRRLHRNGPTSRQDSLTCNCIKSGCLKKYCECYQNGRKCGRQCGCLDCKNLEEKE